MDRILNPLAKGVDVIEVGVLDWTSNRYLGFYLGHVCHDLIDRHVYVVVENKAKRSFFIVLTQVDHRSLEVGVIEERFCQKQLAFFGFYVVLRTEF